MSGAAGGRLTVADALAMARSHDDRIDLRILLGHALGRPHSWLITHPDAELDGPARARFEDLWHRRRAGEPVAYLTGEREFHGLSFAVGPGVLIPRPETELLVDSALEHLPAGRHALAGDLGTGSGAVAVALAFRRPLLRVVATDLSMAALEIARGNASRLGVADRCSFVEGDWCAALAGGVFDALVSNPPYIAEDDPHLDQGDLRFEPRVALTSGPEGLDALTHIIRSAGRHLRAGGHLLLEHGYDQGEAVRTRLAMAGFAGIETRRDLAGIERVTLGRWDVDQVGVADYPQGLPSQI